MKNSKSVKYISLCPKCDSIPSIRIIQKDKSKITIDCLCGYKDTLNIKDYISFLSSVIEKQKFTRDKCKKHNREYNSFCIECNCQLCKSCSLEPTHEIHKLINISAIFEKRDLIQLKKRIVEARKYCISYYAKINHLIISKFNDNPFNTKELFQKNYEVNNNILILLETFLNTYNKNSNNFYSVSNLF